MRLPSPSCSSKRALGVTLLVASLIATLAVAVAGAASLAAPDRDHRLGDRDRRLDGDRQRNRQPERSATTWQFEYGTTTGYGSKAPSTAGERRLGHHEPGRLAAADRPRPGHDLPLPAHGDVDRRHDGRHGRAVHDPGRAERRHRARRAASGRRRRPSPARSTPTDSATSWTVEYGTSTSYGTQTSGQNAGSGTSAVNVSATLTGLAVGKTYHFRCNGTSSAGTTHGADATFLTAQAPTVTTVAASSITGTGAKLNGKVNPNGRPTTYYFEYGTSTSYGSKGTTVSVGNGTSTANVSGTLTGLKGGTTYHFRVVATSDAGTSRGSDLSFVTAAAPAVTAGAVAQLGATSANVGGAVNPNGHSTKWYVEYGTSTSYGTKTATTTIAGSGTSAVPVTATLINLKAGTLYHFRIVATNSVGTTRRPGREPDDDRAADGDDRPGPDHRTLADRGDGHRHRQRPRARGHRVVRVRPHDRLRAATSAVQIAAGITDQPVSAQLSGLAPGVRYHFRVVAMSSAGTATGIDKSFGTPGCDRRTGTAARSSAPRART